MTNIIETFDLTKIFELKGKKETLTALNKVNISIKEGEIFGLLGPNGAGKTTLIQILTTLMQPTSGYAIIDGQNILKNPTKAKSRVSLMLGRSMLYFRITAYDNLKFFCRIYKVPYSKEKIFQAAKEFGLENWLDQYVETFSSGMKMKLALLRTFLLNRPILFLDEPTLGLDVKLKNNIIERIKNLNKTILLTSHDMSVVEKLCNRIAFLNKGNIIKIGTNEDLKKFEHNELKFEIKIIENRNQLRSELNQQNFITGIVDTNPGIALSLNKRENLNKLYSILGKYKILKVHEKELSLEELFLKLND